MEHGAQAWARLFEGDRGIPGSPPTKGEHHVSAAAHRRPGRRAALLPRRTWQDVLHSISYSVRSVIGSARSHRQRRPQGPSLDLLTKSKCIRTHFCVPMHWKYDVSRTYRVQEARPWCNRRAAAQEILDTSRRATPPRPAAHCRCVRRAGGDGKTPNHDRPDSVARADANTATSSPPIRPGASLLRPAARCHDTEHRELQPFRRVDIAHARVDPQARQRCGPAPVVGTSPHQPSSCWPSTSTAQHAARGGLRDGGVDGEVVPGGAHDRNRRGDGGSGPHVPHPGASGRPPDSPNVAAPSL